MQNKLFSKGTKVEIAKKIASGSGRPPSPWDAHSAPEGHIQYISGFVGGPVAVFFQARFFFDFPPRTVQTVARKFSITVPDLEYDLWLWIEYPHFPFLSYHVFI